MLFATADETEDYLAGIVKADPLLIGRSRGFKSTKGVVAGQTSFDDRSFLKLRVGSE
jgi:hypothetical protein